MPFQRRVCPEIRGITDTAIYHLREHVLCFQPLTWPALSHISRLGERLRPRTAEDCPFSLPMTSGRQNTLVPEHSRHAHPLPVPPVVECA